MSPAPTHHRRKSERPHELLEAALQLFVEKGYAATSAAEVAQRAGVSKGTLYLYYPSKEDLLKAVIRRFMSAEIASGAQRFDDFSGSSAEALRTLVAEGWLRLLGSPASGVFKIVIAEVRNFPEIGPFYRDEVIGPGERLISDILRRGIERGEFRHLDEAELALRVKLIVAPLVMLCISRHSVAQCPNGGSDLDAERFVRTHLELQICGLLPLSACDPSSLHVSS
jgi:AcrR family transcriptional regulator